MTIYIQKGDCVPCSAIERSHWYTHQENEYKLKSQGEPYLHKQTVESKASQIKQRGTFNPEHYHETSLNTMAKKQKKQYHGIAIYRLLWYLCGQL